MKVFFDTEFTGLVPNTTLISLGCVAETGEKFYAEFTDYDRDQVDDWIEENVIGNLFLDHDGFVNRFTWNAITGLDWTVKGNSIMIKKYLSEWLESVLKRHAERKIIFVSDVCHYDFYLLCNLFGGALNLPPYICPACYDICQDLMDENDGDIHDMFDAFNYSREEACKFYNQGKLPEGKKHNSLYDAEVIKMIYEGMRK